MNRLLERLMAGCLLLASTTLLSAENAHATDLMKDFDSLGGNDVLLERARELNPEANIRIVQDRVVNRRWREELTMEYGNVLGGDAYLATQNLGANYHVHITPRWSVGVKYNYAFNRLRDEGKYLIQDTSATGKGVIPEMDHPKQSYMAVLNWYPIYGKMNLYDLGVVHFDVYALGGAGQVELKSGRTGTWTAGGGVGLWFSQHLTSRLEMRYQTYEANRYGGKRAMDLAVASFQMGFLHSLF
ncbi:MAG: outer membrane beta-barrel domain-containing protein [Bdellovibrionaceae bacterium]|nr:outer membrane beta-barrel domain-containing protein [Pseudobdellovibrionaceae bacterium]